MNIKRINLEEYVRSVPDFPKKGINFRDVTPLLGDADAFKYCIDIMAAHYKNEKIDRIGAFDARGFLFGAPLAYVLGVPLFPIRKKGKLPYNVISQQYGLEYGVDEVEIHTDAVTAGDRVLLVDDLLATGGTMKAGCKLVEKLGGNVVGCAFVIELDRLGGREMLAGYDVDALLHY